MNKLVYDREINLPVPFEGTKEEIIANWKTHSFAFDDDGGRCVDCDCRPSHAAAHYACGNEPPRKIRYFKDGEIVGERLL